MSRKKCDPGMVFLGCLFKAVGEEIIEDNIRNYRVDCNKVYPANLIEWIK